MDYIEDEFRKYLRHVYPRGIILEQRKQLRQVFVAGIWLLYTEIMSRPLNERGRTEFLNQVEAECREFKEKVMRGEA